MGKLTIDDIAEALGVSKTTVSRAISGKGRIGEKTRLRVKQYIDEHDYTPSAVARGLAQNRTFNIGVIWPESTDADELPFFQKCLIGISDVTGKAGCDILISLYDGKDISNIRRLIRHHKVDGVILTRTLAGDPLVGCLEELGIPAVAIGSLPGAGLPGVDNDNYRACLELTGLLIRRGSRRPALIGGDSSHIITRTRRDSFLAALRKAGIDPVPGLIRLDVGTSSGEDAGSAVLGAAALGADVVICMDDRLAGAALTAAESARLRVPEDILLASFYDSPGLALFSPPVTAISFDDKALGRKSAETLLRLIDGEPAESCVLPGYEIRLRKSTDISSRPASRT